MTIGGIMYLVKMIPGKRSEFKIGKGHAEDIDPIIHSDSLFGALCNNYKKLYGNNALVTFIDKVKNNIKISSCFHGLDIYKLIDGKKKLQDSIYFFPRPMKKLVLDQESEKRINESPKALKRVQFISEEVIKKIQNNEKIVINADLVIDNQYLIDEKDYMKLGLMPYLNDKTKERVLNCLSKVHVYKTIEEQKVNVDRTLETSDTFIAPKIQIQKSEYFVKDEVIISNYVINPFFYFIIECENSIDKELNAAITLIEDEGIGGDRSSGCGFFEKIEINLINNEFKDLFTKGTNFCMNMSLMFPRKEDFKNIKRFNLIDRTSFITSSKNKSFITRKIRLIEEGSIFREKLKGDLVQVAPEEFKSKYHDVCKYGFGFYLPIGDFVE